VPELAAELVHHRVAVIVSSAGAAAFAAKAATATIPIVFLVGEDPVKLGLVSSLARPSGNLTGINLFTAELAAKRLEILRELVPQVARVAVLVNPADVTTTESALKDAEAAARAMGLQVHVANAYQPRNRHCFRNYRASGNACRVRLELSLLRWTARPIGPIGRVTSTSHDIFVA